MNLSAALPVNSGQQKKLVGPCITGKFHSGNSIKIKVIVSHLEIYDFSMTL